MELILHLCSYMCRNKEVWEGQLYTDPHPHTFISKTLFKSGSESFADFLQAWCPLSVDALISAPWLFPCFTPPPTYSSLWQQQEGGVCWHHYQQGHLSWGAESLAHGLGIPQYLSTYASALANAGRV